MTSDWRNPRSLALLAGFLILVMGVGGLIGTMTAPGEWYDALDKPPFNPPNWLFGPVWTILYVFIAIAGWRTFRRDWRSPAMLVWVAQMVVNWTWSPVFFSLQALWPAAAIIVAILALILTFIALSWRKDRVSALLFVPYAAWVGFATLLNISIAWLN